MRVGRSSIFYNSVITNEPALKRVFTIYIMKQLWIACFAFFITSGVLAQDFEAQFNSAFQKQDTAKQRNVLVQWEQDAPEDPELFTSYFNYYFRLAKKEVMTLSGEQPGTAYLTLEDSTGKTAGYMGSNTHYHAEIMSKAFMKIDKGIELYPNRLDMRFGKIHVLGEVEDWTGFTEAIVKTLHYSIQNANQWTWTHGEKRAGGETFFLSALQDYQLTLYNKNDDALLQNMRTIAQQVLEYYPNHVESLSNLSVTYLLTGDYDKGIEALVKAEAINPDDGVVLSNIAQAYKLKGDTPKAKVYYMKMLQLEDPQAVAFAKQQLEQLNEE